MLQINLKLDGMDGALAALEEVFEGLAPAASQGVGRGAALVQGEARKLAPMDTGELRGSIAVSGPHASDGGASAQITAAAAHAPYVELGTAATPALPFLYPAFMAQREAAAQAIMDAVRKAVNG